MANGRFVYLWPVYGLFINGQCTACLSMASVRLFINGQCTDCLFMAQTVHWP
jgi:hypothetical protein